MGESGAWSYTGTAQIFWVHPIISGTDKATNFKFCLHILSIDRNKNPLQISGKVAGGVCEDSRNFSGHPLYWAHRAVVFAIARLSCSCSWWLDALQGQRPSLRRFKSIRDEICHDCSSSKYASIDRLRIFLLTSYWRPRRSAAARCCVCSSVPASAGCPLARRSRVTSLASCERYIQFLIYSTFVLFFFYQTDSSFIPKIGIRHYYWCTFPWRKLVPNFILQSRFERTEPCVFSKTVAQQEEEQDEMRYVISGWSKKNLHTQESMTCTVITFKKHCTM